MYDLSEVSKQLLTYAIKEKKAAENKFNQLLIVCAANDGVPEGVSAKLIDNQWVVDESGT